MSLIIGPDTLSPYGEPKTENNKSLMRLEPLYKSLRSFKTGSFLHRYLAERKSKLISISTTTYRISTILLALREIIEEEQLFDPLNKSIIVLNKELERGLDVHSLTISQMKTRLEAQLYEKFGIEPVQTLDQAQKELEAMNFWFSMTDSDIEPKPIPKSEFGKGVLCKVAPAMKKVLQTVSKKPLKGSMAYENICYLTSNYIMENKHLLFDLRNIKICIAKNNILGEAFGVNYFARSQVTSLIRKQLTIVQPVVKRLTRSQAKLP